MSTHTSMGEVQAAVYSKLTGDSTLMSIITGVFDFGAVPVSQAYPFVSFGAKQEGPDNAFQKRGYDLTLTLDIWDNTPGFKRAQSILARLNDLLDQPQQLLTLATLKHVSTLYDFSEELNDPGTNSIRHIPARYKIFSQE